MSGLATAFTRQVGIEVPLICGAMYPCSNPELVAAVSAAGGIGIIQPISMSFVHKRELREGIRWIRAQTDKPIGFNAIVEKSSSVYTDRMKKWVDIALEEGVRFFITALGDPRWVADKVHAAGGIVYHDVTERKWADKALEGGVDGLICVNKDAGGHAGTKAAAELYAELASTGKPLVCAGGVGDPAAFARALDLGYAGVQLGTRFIATRECHAHDDYKQAILRARPEDIVLTERISGVPVAVIKTPYVEKIGTEASWLMKRALRHAKLKHYARMYYSAKSVFELRKASLQGVSYKDFFQAGKSVGGIDAIEPAGDVVRRFAAAARARAA
ncbi:MAG: nitronate monooxygenase [Kofleriaceae bacterium]|nr:MAG: nitronate monooxygenase [Kofleriaceae bacterium]MBZ0238248.1 nitronate monooxygenase [Kofleriaceae bacterium]